MSRRAIIEVFEDVVKIFQLFQICDNSGNFP